MKAGIMETADLYVINKAELPGSDQLACELLSVVSRSTEGGAPVVIQVRAGDDTGVTELSTAIDQKFAQALTSHAAGELQQTRRKYQVQRLIQRRLLEVLDSLPELTWSESLLQRYQKTLEQLQADLDVVRRRSQGGNHK
jgi:LAO/AO transport system kinase